MAAMDGLKAMAMGPAKPPAVVEPVDPKREGVLLAANDLLSAIKSGDPELVADALSASHRACSGDAGKVY